MPFRMWISSVSERGRSACRAESCGPGPALRLRGPFAHPHHPVDLAAFLHQKSLGGDVAVHTARGLNFDTLVGVNTAPHFPADDGLTRHHIALDRAALRHQHLATGADGPDDCAFHLHDAFSRDVADDAHAGADDRQPGLRAAWAMALFREHRHQLPSFTNVSGSSVLPSRRISKWR